MNRHQCQTMKMNDGRRCLFMASFLVRIGTRKSDERWSCAKHVAQTVIAFQDAEDRRSAQVTVTWLPNGLTPSQ